MRPHSGPAHLLLATAMLSQGKWDECFGEFREALRLAPDDATIYHSLGVDYQARGGLGRAATVYREANRRFPADTIARANLGDLMLAQGRLEEAAATLREAVGKVPDLPRPTPDSARRSPASGAWRR